MDSLKKSLPFLFLWLFIQTPALFSQNNVETDTGFKVSDEERIFINELNGQANKLIWHVNVNVISLKNYQEELNTWYASGQSLVNAPDYYFSPNSNKADLKMLLNMATIDANNKLFNYKANLLKLNQETELFNSLCRQLQALPKTGSKENYYDANQKVFVQIENMSNTFMNLSYDFSLASAINYGREKMPVELDRMKNLVGQAKNLIMAIRLNDPKQVKAYLNQLNLAIVESEPDQEFSNFIRVGKFTLSNVAVQQLHAKILQSANTIAYWGEQYIQSNIEPEEVSFILENAVVEFNQFENRKGCAGNYNELVSFAKVEYLNFTEEPLFFKVKRTELPKQTASSISKKTEDTIKTPVVKTPEVNKVESIEAPKPVFDANNLNSLDGALPNNIIIMMDVSASMKTTGKLPLLKSSINHLLNIMRPEDRISLLAYSGKAEVLIGNVGIANKSEIRNVLDTLHSSGGTDIENGVKLGYETALKSYMKNGNNRIIIATDGEFGVRTTLLKLVQEKALTGVVLSVFQFDEDKNNARNPNLQLLANTGRGTYRTISSSDEALKELMLEVKKKGL